MYMCGQGLLNNKQSAQALTNQRREYFQPAVPFHVSSCHIPNPFLPMQQLPDALRMTEERKLSNTNTIKLSGNLIGLLSRGTVAFLLWGDNESHHSLLGWKKGASSVVIVCVCTCICVYAHASSLWGFFLVRWGPISKQHSATTKKDRSPTEYSLGEMSEKYCSLNQAKVQILTL